MNTSRAYDVVSIGETMIRYSPPATECLEQSRQLELHVGGSESNTLVGLARLGMSTCWVSRLTDNAMGRIIAGEIAAHGVDTQYIRWTPDDRVGVYYYEPGYGARPGRVIYDRAHSAFSRLDPDVMPTAALQQTRLLHLTGISLALGESVRKSILRACDISRSAGAKIGFDFNYRAKLWSMSDAREHCAGWLERSDVVFIALRDAIDWLSIQERLSEESVFARLLARRANGVTVMTLGSEGAMAGDGRQTVRVGTAAAEGVGRLGAGDAFSAGFLFGWLQGWDLERSLRWGNAAAQHKFTTPGDIPWFTRQDLELTIDHSPEKRLYR